MLDQLTGHQAKKLVDQVGEPFKKAPHLPKGFVEFLVKIAPFLAGLGGVLSLLGALQTLSVPLGFSAASSFMKMFVAVDPIYWWITGLLSLASGALLLMAYKPLSKRKMEGWMYMFWVEVLTVVQMIVGIVYGLSSIVGVVIGILIGFYVLYELKPHYSSVAKAE